MKKNYLIIGILFLTLLFTAGCGQIVGQIVDGDSSSNEEKESTEAKADKDSKKSNKLGDYQIEFSGEVIEEDGRFIVEGQSNLLPGSRVVGEVIVDEGETVFSDTSELIEEDGSFYMDLEHHQYGDAEIVIRFDFEGVQEDEIKRHYGEKGQKLEGPFIYKHETYDGILNKAEVKLNYTSGGGNDLTLKAPEWNELPEDYGDPRVWLEIDDITEDGEFFYVSGRSNILEGSTIEVSYQYNRGKTQIKPDGSFDLKFDYEYLEDKEIVITFEPSSWQWNEIEEAYGSTGQKLIGNLVVSDKYNTDKQYIEKRIPWDNKSAKSSDNKGESDDDSNETEEEADLEETDEE
ncbi:hypothetical protein SPD48_01745 [Pseudogracilibacillus sp. SE30717A]|uniref:hypothetical protein n=1 Tax=Pseudogracilibacillus sp. SE30717A TaxID=3098293 RepID=UPI00300DEF6A